MRWGRRIFAGVLAVSALLGATASAANSESFGGAVAFRLQGSHGYSIFVLVGARPGEAVGEAVVLVGKPHEQAVYEAPATFTEAGIEADLGALGKIALTAQPTGTERTAHPQCGKPVRYEAVSYVGSFEFRGEGGYTTASATRLPMLVTPLLNFVCSATITGKSGGPNLSGAGLHVGSRGQPPHLSLLARTNGPGKAVGLSASLQEQHGEIRIERSVDGRYGSSIFTYDPHLSTATLAPPAPFSGRGVFRRAASPANRWSGNLRIDFAGRSNVRVTGDRYRPVLRHGEWFSMIESDRPRLAAPALQMGRRRRRLRGFAPAGGGEVGERPGWLAPFSRYARGKRQG
jgi:hypothetical protein